VPRRAGPSAFSLRARRAAHAGQSVVRGAAISATFRRRVRRRGSARAASAASARPVCVTSAHWSGAQ
jgi:hypothetical protein